jgi:hypothetical protein
LKRKRQASAGLPLFHIKERTMLRIAGAASIALTLSFGAATAQQQIEWKQTIATPKGLNLPKDVKGDILGIELGDSYAEVSEKLQRLLLETEKPSPNTKPFSVMTSIGIQRSGIVVPASYIHHVKIDRRLKGNTAQPPFETIAVDLTAPSSGSQVINIERTITYPTVADQPRLADILASLRDKFKAEPQQINPGTYRIFFNDGRSYTRPNENGFGCLKMFAGPPMTEIEFATFVNINKAGDCDVVLDVSVSPGVSKETVNRISFTLSDNERAKINRIADAKFLQTYAEEHLKKLKGQANGAAPKL